MTDQATKAAAFRALHERDGAFIIPNPWDAGTAKILQSLGFEALATTSFGVGNMLGKIDDGRNVTKDDILANVRDLCAASDLPVNADLENGFADAPEDAAAILAQAYAAGAVGGSIEDTTANADKPVYAFELAVDRIKASVEAARNLPGDFVLTARADGMLPGAYDLKEAIRRLQAFQDAGADVLYAPGVKDLDMIKTVLAEIDRPFNVVMGFADPDMTLEQLSEIGVKRVSLGGALSRVALNAFIKSALEMRDQGGFTFIRDMATAQELHGHFS